MKNLTIFLLSIALFGACEKVEDPISSGTVVDVHALVGAYNQDKLPQDQAQILEGELAYYTVNKDALLVTITDGDETVSAILQVADLPEGLLATPKDTRKAVALPDEFLILGKLDEVLFSLVLADKESPSLLPHGAKATQIAGYGLIYTDQIDPVRFTTTNLKSEGFFVPLGGNVVDDVDCGCVPSGGSDRGCDAGGQGASACSLGNSAFHSGCSVNCQDGYFACCSF